VSSIRLPIPPRNVASGGVQDERGHDAGILTTASDLLFSGGCEGYFFALDARNGNLLWKAVVGGNVASVPMTYLTGGRQYMAVAAGNSLSPLPCANSPALASG